MNQKNKIMKYTPSVKQKEMETVEQVSKNSVSTFVD